MITLANILLSTVLLAVLDSSSTRRAPSSAKTVEQPATMTGAWHVVWDSDIRSNRGVVERVNKRSTAQLVLSQRGDSVTGRWVDGLLNDAASTEPGVAVSGAVHGDTLIITTGQVRSSRGGIRVSMHGVRHGEKIAGTMYVELAGLAPAPRKWEGERRSGR